MLVSAKRGLLEEKSPLVPPCSQITCRYRHFLVDDIFLVAQRILGLHTSMLEYAAYFFIVHSFVITQAILQSVLLFLAPTENVIFDVCCKSIIERVPCSQADKCLRSVRKNRTHIRDQKYGVSHVPFNKSPSTACSRSGAFRGNSKPPFP